MTRSGGGSAAAASRKRGISRGSCWPSASSVRIASRRRRSPGGSRPGARRPCPGWAAARRRSRRLRGRRSAVPVGRAVVDDDTGRCSSAPTRPRDPRRLVVARDERDDHASADARLGSCRDGLDPTDRPSARHRRRRGRGRRSATRSGGDGREQPAGRLRVVGEDDERRRDVAAELERRRGRSGGCGPRRRSRRRPPRGRARPAARAGLLRRRRTASPTPAPSPARGPAGRTR